MGCVVNGPGESKHADIGISLPGTFEDPVAPVFIDGQLDRTLRGDAIVARVPGHPRRLRRAPLPGAAADPDRRRRGSDRRARSTPAGPQAVARAALRAPLGVYFAP